MSIKTIIEKVMEKDVKLVDAINQIKANKITFKDLFTGTAKDKLKIIIKGAATFVVTYMKKYEATNNLTEDQLVDEVVDHILPFIPAIPIPLVGGLVTKYVYPAVFHFLIHYAINYVNQTSEITVAYKASLDVENFDVA